MTDEGLVYGHNRAGNRVFSVTLLVGAALVLVLSFLLTPSPSGIGTHCRLLGVPCLFHHFTGLPCPFCGMTTAFAHMARGEIAGAFSAHVLGPALYVLTWAAGVLGAIGLIRGRWPLPAFAMSSRFNQVVIVVILAAWIVNVWRCVF